MSAAIARPFSCLPTAAPTLWACMSAAIASRLAAVWLLLAAGVVAGDDRLATCNAASHFNVLEPAASDEPGDARGVWLDARHLRWPGAAPGRFRLYWSSNAQLVARSGHSVHGADGAIALQAVDAPAAAAGFPHLAAGVDLQLSAADAGRLADRLRGQLLLVREDADGRVLEATRTQLAGALDALYRDAEHADDLGVRLDRTQSRFALWAPTATAVALCLFPDPSSKANGLLAASRDSATGIWRAAGDGALAGGYYTWLVDVFVPALGIVRNRVTDPYATSLSTDSQRVWVGDLDDAAVKPAGWDDATRPAPLAAPTDAMIYELHLRDFSIGDASVPPALRGTYLAFTETASAGMRHLAALANAGLTDIHLLPVFDIASIPEHGCVSPSPEGAPDSEAQQALIAEHKHHDCFNWGYDPQHYTAPEGSYASDPADGARRIVEFRRMVQALHRLGLRVGMDVVYNHTSHSGQHEKSVLDRIVPGYYHRLDSDGRIETSTCCDNTATEHRMMAKLMIDSVIVLARDHRIDAFRFDLMGHQPRSVMERLQREVNAAAGRPVQLIGEGWNFGEVADGARFVQASQLSLAGSGIATFSDRARDAVRGGGAADSGIELLTRQGWLNGLHDAPNAASVGLHSRQDLLRAADLVRVGLAGSLRDYRMIDHRGRRVALAEIDYAGQPAGYVAAPGEVVNYVENHDNPTLFDINALRLPADTPSRERARVQILGNAVVAFSQGIAYFHAGTELLRSKSLDRNSYDSGDWFNRLDFSLQDNGFGAGLPPAWDNADSWDVMRPVLANPAIKPAPADIAWTRDAFLDLLRIRASSTLFRLRSADDVIARLRLHNVGPEQIPTVLAAQIDGRGYPGAGFDEIVYFINVSDSAQALTLPDAAGKPYRLHPVQRAAEAADPRPREQARYAADSGRFEIPPRSAVVFVIEGDHGAALLPPLQGEGFRAGTLPPTIGRGSPPSPQPATIDRRPPNGHLPCLTPACAGS
jgi:pullulanase